MAEAVPVPANIDNCLYYCTVFAPKGPARTREIIRIALEGQCPGPVVREQIVDIRNYKDPVEQTSVDHERFCGLNFKNEPTETFDGSPVAGVRTLTQEELRGVSK